jgi:hypothetical protein
MNAVLSEEPPDLSATSASIPIPLERVVRRYLEKVPENRFQSARDLRFSIEVAAPRHRAATTTLVLFLIAVAKVMFPIIARRNNGFPPGDGRGQCPPDAPVPRTAGGRPPALSAAAEVRQ